MHIPPSLAAAVAAQYRQNLTGFPQQLARAEAFCRGFSPAERLGLQYLYGSAPAADLLRYDPPVWYAYVKAALAAAAALPLLQGVPWALALPYVLGARVNNEELDDSRPRLLQALLPRVRGLTPRAALLEVNYWCAEQGEYTPTDDRTLSASGFWRAGHGRCGEESVFTVNALRAVGIPARQCYAPWWAHCDDNHAWVEAWVQGGWHYLGACEPEPAPDRGWFTAAARRAMVVHTRAFCALPEAVLHAAGDVGGKAGRGAAAEAAGKPPCAAAEAARPQITAARTAHTRLLHVTAAYAPCASLTVTVRENGRPLPGVGVQFLLANTGRLLPVFSTATDAAGQARITCGLGSLYVWACCADGRQLGLPVDLRRCRALTLPMETADTPAALCSSGRQQSFELTPPPEHSLPPAPADDLPAQAHAKKLAACAAAVRQREAAFSALPKTPAPWETAPADGFDSGRPLADGAAVPLPAAAEDAPPVQPGQLRGFCRLARGNRADVERFLADGRFPLWGKAALLAALRPKDLVDVTADALADFLLAALPYRPRLPFAVWRDAVLCPRVENEPLRPHRQRLRAAYLAVGAPADVPPGSATECVGVQPPIPLRPEPTDGCTVWQALRARLTVCPDDAPTGCTADPAACLEAGKVPVASLPLLFVAVCRSFGIPARRDAVTGDALWWGAGQWRSPQDGCPPALYPLTLAAPDGCPLEYDRQFSLARWKDGGWQTLPLAPLALCGKRTLRLPAGLWRAVTVTRQIDGTASVRLRHFALPETQSLCLQPAPDQTADRLKAIPLGRAVPQLPLQLTAARPAGALLLWVQPGAEPTEHLLQELLACRAQLNALGCAVHLLLGAQADAQNATLQAVLRALPNADCRRCAAPETLQAMRAALEIGDPRLPLAVAVDADGLARYAFANYNIDTAAALLRILRLTGKKEEPSHATT